MNGQKVHNIQKRSPVILAIMVTILLGSCDFKPKDEFFRDIAPSIAPPQVTIGMNGGKDTLVCSPVGLDVIVDAGKNRPNWVKILIDDSLADIYPLNNKNFHLNPSIYIPKDGVYRMRMEFGIGAGTGSIADRIGAENFVFTRNLCLIGLKYAEDLPGLTVKPESGTILLQCLTNGKAMIDRSVIIKGPFTGGMDHDTVDVIDETMTVFGYDDSYVGEQTWYQRKAFLGNREHTFLYPYGTSSVFKEKDLPAITVTNDVNGVPTIRWTKNKFPMNLEKYRLFRYDLGYYTLIDSTTNPSDTVFTYLNFKFPDEMTLLLASVPKNTPRYFTRDVEVNYYSTTSYNNFSGIPSFRFTDLQSPAGGDFYYNYNRSIFRYNNQDQKVTDVITAPGTDYYAFDHFSVSPNNRFVISLTGLSSFDYMVYNATTRQKSYFPGSQVAGQNPYTTAVIADNGIGMVAANGKMTIHDFVTNQRIMRIKVPQSGPPVRISAEGKYFITGLGSSPELYRVDTDTITRIWGFTQPPYGVTFCEFVPGNPEQVVVFGMNTLTVRKCSDFSVVRTLNLDLGRICNIDFNTGRILGLYTNSTTQTYEWRIYDLDNGALLKRVPRGGTVYLTDTRLNDQFLYWTDGYKFRIF